MRILVVKVRNERPVVDVNVSGTRRRSWRRIFSDSSTQLFLHAVKFVARISADHNISIWGNN